MKKLLSILLCMFMLFMSTATVFAEDNTYNVASQSDLDTALSSINAISGSSLEATINVTSDFTMTKRFYIQKKGLTLTINGNGYTITATQNGDSDVQHVFDFSNKRSVESNVYINDLSIIVGDGFRHGICMQTVENGSRFDLYLNNVSVKMNHTRSPKNESNEDREAAPIIMNSSGLYLSGDISIETDKYSWAAIDAESILHSIPVSFEGVNTFNVVDRRNETQRQLNPLIKGSEGNNKTIEYKDLENYDLYATAKGYDYKVCEMNGAYYHSIFDALYNVTDSSKHTIKLVNNAGLGEKTSITADRNIVIDLNDYVLDLNGYHFENSGELTITDTNRNTIRYFVDSDQDNCYEKNIGNNSSVEDSIKTVGGVITGGRSDSYGGAIENAANATLNIKKANFVGNKSTSPTSQGQGQPQGQQQGGGAVSYAAYSGGAIVNHGTLNIGSDNHSKSDVLFAGNASANNGGAICNSATMTINGATFTNNSTEKNGGAIINVFDNSGEVKCTIENTDFFDNQALTGSAITNYDSNCTLNMYSSNINNDNLGEDVILSAGAIANLSGAKTTLGKMNAPVIIKNCDAKENGGAIMNVASTLTLDYVTIENCSAKGYGGAIYNEGVGTAILTINKNAKISNCSAVKFGGAIFNKGLVDFKDGLIEYCKADKGGAIHNDGTSGVILNMSGGTIDNAIAVSCGAGIQNSANATLNLSGGKIVNSVVNDGYAGGIFNKGTLNISGNPVVKNNYAYASYDVDHNLTYSAKSNIAVVDDKTIIISSALTGDKGSIGISNITKEDPQDTCYITKETGYKSTDQLNITTSGTEYASKFFSDDHDYYVSTKGGKIGLTRKVAPSLEQAEIGDAYVSGGKAYVRYSVNNTSNVVARITGINIDEVKSGTDITVSEVKTSGSTALTEGVDFSIEEGSIKVIIKDSYISKLAIGTHNLQVSLTDTNDTNYSFDIIVTIYKPTESYTVVKTGVR